LTRRLQGILASLLCLLSAGALLWGCLRAGRPLPSNFIFPPAKSNLPSIRSQYAGGMNAEPPQEIQATATDSGTTGDERQVIVFTAQELGRRHLYAHWPANSLFEPLLQGNWDDVSPTFSPDGDRLLFSSNRGGKWDLYVLDRGESEPRQLTATAGFEGRAAWSPDGQWIAFEADYAGNLDIWLMPVEAPGDLIQLTTDPGADMAPAWHSNGRWIAFVSNRDGEKDIYLADLDPAAGGITNLTRTMEGDEDEPQFNPAGGQIAFTSLRDGVAQIAVSDWPPESGSGRVRIMGQGGAPAWSPNGDSIAALLQGRDTNYLLTFPLQAPTPPGLVDFPAGRYQSLTWAETNWLVPTEGARGTMEELKAEPPFSGTRPSDGERGTVSELSMVEAPNPYLLTGVDQAFNALRACAAERVGWDFLGNLENAFVGLNEPLPPGTDYDDWLRTGRAFSFHLGALKAEWVEIVREDYGGQTFWRVYVRVRPQDGTRGQPLRTFPWDFEARYSGDPLAYDQGGALKAEIPAGYYFDFTALAADYGFERLPALPNWRTYYHGSRFNQFVFREGLSWEQAMLEIYPAEAIATSTPFRTPTPTVTLTLTPTWTLVPTATPWTWPTSTMAPQSAPISTGEAP
jgi:TolB protein